MDVKTAQQAAVYVIPAALSLLSCFSRKVIEDDGWKKKFFFMGPDLTIYSLAISLVNVLDLTRNPKPPSDATFWSVVLISTATLFLAFQTSIHQDWEKDKTGRMQTFLLCVVSNLMGLGLISSFVRLKLENSL